MFAPGKRPGTGSTARMLASIAHRGPDDSGVRELDDGAVILGHRRLSIIDLSPSGHQPMGSGDGKAWITFNGEIYNFREIRAELEHGGCPFRSQSDTEVVLEAYRRWGVGAIQRLRGMFAFALWDCEARVLHLARDRFGVKPLYYSVSAGVLAFASELKALNGAGFTSRRIDPVAASEYLRYGYVSAPRSVFDDVRTVEPGTVVTFDAGIHPKIHRYWSLLDLFISEEQKALRRELSAMGEDALLDRVEAALGEAFAYRMVADVPVGLFLSGGIDSSLVATILARRAGLRLKTYTIGYGTSEFDETTYARVVAEQLGADHTEFMVSPDEALKLNDRIPDIMDEPIGDSSLIPTLMVSQLARRHVTVALSADGADELFGGYARYRICGSFADRLPGVGHWGYRLAAGMLESLPVGMITRAYALTRGRGPRFAAINDKLRKFVRMARSSDVFAAYDSSVSEWSTQESRKLLPGEASGSEGAARTFSMTSGVAVREQFMHFDAARYLPGDLLTKVDRASMAVSLEAREPCLDHEMARLAVALPLDWKMRDGRNKYVLRRILARHLPPGLFDRPKQGFSAPIAAWLRGSLRAQLLDELAPERVRRFGILDPQTTSDAASSCLRGDRRTSAAGIWFLLQLQRWAGRWLKAPAAQSGGVPR